MAYSQLISTVGASLTSNLSLMARSDVAVSTSERNLLCTAYEKRQWDLVGKCLGKFSPSERLCGAEINTIHELEKRNLLHTDADLHFCCSETSEGDAVAEILKSYYRYRKRGVHTYTIHGLQDKDENRFRREGLRYLVQKVAELIRKAGGTNIIAINATGGYKAQIALAALMGQTLKAQVFYKHEKFPGVIGLPPMPVDFDYSLLERHADILLGLEQESLVAYSGELSEAILPLVEEMQEEEQRYLSLSAVGQLYLEGYRLRFPAHKTLPPDVPEGRRKQPAFRHDHYPQGFREYVHRIWEETPYIVTTHSESYDGQKGIRDRVFYIRPDNKIIGEYQDKDRFGGRFSITTLAERPVERMAVVDDLTRRFSKI